jgi:hypothetical protein
MEACSGALKGTVGRCQLFHIRFQIVVLECPRVTLTNGETLDILLPTSGGRADPARAAVAHGHPSWIPAPRLAIELGISRRTLKRWGLTPKLEFPRPTVVNHRLYYDRAAIEAWKIAAAIKAAGAR